jgi:hypothetical protein
MRFERLHNRDQDVDDLLGNLVDTTEAQLNGRVGAIYITGSLAYGDFIPARSDIDGFCFFDGCASEDDLSLYRKMIFDLEGMYPVYEGRILDPPVSTSCLEDRQSLDRSLGPVNLTSLIQSGKLIYGREILMSVRPPTRWELDTHMAQDVANVLRRSPEKIPCAVEDDVEAINGYLTKSDRLLDWLLYPARVLYTMKTGRISSKRTAVVHYCLSHRDRFNVWLEQAIEMRSQVSGGLSENQVRPIMEVTVDFFWRLVNVVQFKMGLMRKGEEEVETPAEAINRFRRLLDVA